MYCIFCLHVLHGIEYVDLTVLIANMMRDWKSVKDCECLTILAVNPYNDYMLFFYHTK